MDFQYEDTYAPYERIATSSGTGQGNAGLVGLTDAALPGAAPQQVSLGGGQGLLAGAVAGFLGAAVAVGVANLAAAFVGPQASPIIVVGGALKHLAVEKFGENAKNPVLFGMYFTIALLAMGIGMVAWRRVWVGVLGIGQLGLAGAYLAVTGPGSHATDALPSIVGGIAGIAALLALIRVGTHWMGYEAHSDESPSYESRSYESAGYERPGYETPGYETANYGTPAYGTPAYDTAAYETPGYDATGYDATGYETPAYDATGYETAGYGTPGYEFPARETPAYESATYRTTGWTS